MGVVVLLVGWAVVAQATPSSQSDPPDPATVRRLVRQLNDDELSRREAAERALIRLGPPLLSLLPTTDAERLPTEVEERLRRIRDKLERNDAARVAQPARVSLKGQHSLSDALESLENQTGNRVTRYEERPGWVKLDLDQVLYWEALDQVLDQAQLSINPFGGKPNVLTVASRPPDVAPRYGKAVYSEAFRFEPLRIESRRDLRNPAVDGTQLTIGVSWEPRLSIILLRQPLDQVKAFDSRGRSLPVRRSRATVNVPVDGGISSVELGIPLARPERDVKEIASLKGSLAALIPGAAEVFEFSDLGQARRVHKQVAGVTVTLEQWRKNLDVFEAHVRVRFDDAGGALESYRGWIYRNPTYLLGPDGARIEHVGVHLIHQDANEVGLSLLFDLPDGSDGCRLVYKTPTVMLRVSVPYELTGIPLP